MNIKTNYLISRSQPNYNLIYVLDYFKKKMLKIRIFNHYIAFQNLIRAFGPMVQHMEKKKINL